MSAAASEKAAGGVWDAEASVGDRLRERNDGIGGGVTDRAERRHRDRHHQERRVQDGSHARPLDPQSVGRAAAHYVELGYGAFPINSSTKLPRFRKGAHPRWAPDPEGAAGHLLAAWGVDDVERHWPMARGVGVGLVPPDGVAFLDLDEKHVKGVVEFVRTTWPAIFANGEHRSRRGGAHVPTAVPSDVKLGQSVDAGLGIDVRLALKGYVVAPPTPGYEVVRPTGSRGAPHRRLRAALRRGPPAAA